MPVVNLGKESSKYSFHSRYGRSIVRTPILRFRFRPMRYELRRDSLGIHLSAVFASVFRHGFLIVRGVRARTASLHGCRSARIPIVPPR